MTKLFASDALTATVVDPREYPGWDRLVLSHSGHSFFHSAAWARVLCRTYRHRPMYLYLTQDNEPAALIPLMEVRSLFTGCRGVGLPFCDFCDPLLFGQCDAAAVESRLFKLARERKWNYVELRGGSASTAESVAFYGHKLDLRRGIENLFAGLKSSARGAIRKAERYGLQVQAAQTREALLEFYQLHVRTRKRHGLPPQPLSFFLNIQDEIIEPGRGFIMMAHHGSRPVAAAVFFQFGGKAVYKFSASDESLKQYQGNNLVIWKAIEVLAQNGIEELHFGRTPLENEGLRRFKLAWGTAEERIPYFRFGASCHDSVITLATIPKLLRSVSARLPISLNRVLGAIIYPHLSTIAIALSPLGL